MSDPDQSFDQTRCWECGSPSSAGCASVQVLTIPSRLHAYGEGYPVQRGRRQDVVRIAVPRCVACRNRGYATLVLVVGGLVLGLSLASYLAPPSKLRMLGGGVGGYLAGVAAALAYRRLRGLKSVADYPPVKRLRARGWREPD